MTLAAPRSHQGKLALVLVIFAALVAVSAALVWANIAQAQLPNTTTELDQDPDGPGTIVPGETVTYDASATTTLTVTVGDALVVEIEIPANLSNAAVACSPAADGSNVTGSDATCWWDDATAGTYTTTLDGVADGDLAVPASAVCAVTQGVDDCDGASGNDIESVVDNDADTGTLTVDVSGLVTADPADATNPPGTSHVITFSAGPNVNCLSADDLGDDDDLPVTCDLSDVALSCGNTTVDSVVPQDTNVQDATDIVVTITNDGTDADCTVTLHLVANDGNDDVDDDIFFDAEATKSFSAAAVADGELRHLDEPDAATEDENADRDDYCDTVTGVCGIISPQDDPDDATGSFHEACIIGSVLTSADNPFITWNILPGPGSSATVNPGPNGQKVAGPNDEPCVRWSSGGTGSQTITATYDNGVAAAIDLYYDPSVPLPLVKQWNTIDETKIVAVTGVVGDTLAENTLGLGGTTTDWANRDCTTAGYCDDPNLDGLTMQQEAAYILNTPLGILVSAAPRSFIDYTMGSHSDAGGTYNGPVDGAEQTYTISGDCGSVRLEDPASGNVIILSNSGTTSATVLSSDKGVGFTFVPTSDGSTTVTLNNADCGPLAVICIDISTEEDNLFRSPPIDDAPDESICVEYTVGPPTDKTPILAWAGQRVIVEHYWGNADGTCPVSDDPNSDPDEFGVLYTKQDGPGSFTAALQSNGFNDVDQTNANVIVDVDYSPTDDDNDGVIDANSGCISRVIYESEGPGQVDISAYVVDDNDNLNNADPRSQQVAFVIYFMKFEDLTLGIVPGSRDGHNSGSFSPANPLDTTTDVTEMDSNVSADVLVRARVRGWVYTDNCPARDSGVGANGEFLPANRCIFPDDWNFKAGGVLAEETRPNFDVLNTPPTPPLPGQNVCSADPRAAGPFSWLDTNVDGDVTADVCGDSLAPNVVPNNECLYAIGYSCRETVFPNGIVDMYDANMPPALLTFTLTDSGFLHGADKDDVYPNNSNLFYATHIPAEPYIAPINADLSGYSWNTWGGPGAKSGQYDFWNDLADTGVLIPDTGGVGYDLTRVYTDNHGEAMTWVNGDANLTYDDCDTASGTAGNNIIQLSGFYCEEGEVVGTSTVGSYVDYPDKRKHFAIASNDVTITWTWGGIKYVTVEPGENAQFNYVVLHLTDRDGFCDPTPSLNPVIGEQVVFTIDSPNGIIFPDGNGNAAALLGSYTTKTADVTTFDTDGTNSALTIEPVIKDGECQAWIHVSESLLQPVNVIVTAYDPEGTVTFDVTINPATPTPAPVTPAPTPANQPNLWADIDCSDNVDPVDALKILRHDAGLSISQGSSCPDAGEAVDVLWNAGDNSNELWGDADCNNTIDPVDTLKVLRYDAGLFYLNQQPCPDISEEVLITAQ